MSTLGNAVVASGTSCGASNNKVGPKEPTMLGKSQYL